MMPTDLRAEFELQVWDRIWNQVGGPVLNRVTDQVRAQDRVQVRIQVLSRVGLVVRHQVWNQAAEDTNGKRIG
jgi:hypothetical protein